MLSFIIITIEFPIYLCKNFEHYPLLIFENNDKQLTDGLSILFEPLIRIPKWTQ